jgi:hypothetical protein
MITAPTLYTPDYRSLLSLTQAAGHIYLRDHLLGFDQNMKNVCLDHLAIIAQDTLHVWWHVILDPRILNHYTQLKFHGCASSAKMWYRHFGQYRYTKNKDSFSNFLSCFNGSEQIGRKLLASALHKRAMFTTTHCSKNFTIDPASLDAQIGELATRAEDHAYHLKLYSFDPEFLSMVNGFDYQTYRYNHADNIHHMEPKLTQSFINLVSEGYSTSYYPFFTEKFLYAVATQSLFLAWAQPQWHWQLSHVFGFKLYDKIFNYDFDWIEPPLSRLTRLLDLLGRYQNFKPHEWHDLYLMQQDEILYNYHHMISGDFIDTFQKHA